MAAVREDEELAAQLSGVPRPEPLESPPFYGFTDDRYDYAQIITLLQLILVAAQRGDVSKARVSPLVPVPAVDRIKRDQKRVRLRSWVKRFTGEEG